MTTFRSRLRALTKSKAARWFASAIVVGIAALITAQTQVGIGSMVSWGRERVCESFVSETDSTDPSRTTVVVAKLSGDDDGRTREAVEAVFLNGNFVVRSG